MENLDYTDSTTGSARPLADDGTWGGSQSPEKHEGIIRDKDDAIEYIPKRMSKLSDEEISYSEYKMASTSQKCSRCLYSCIIAIATLSLLMTAIVHIFAWYQEDIEQLPNQSTEIGWFKYGRKDAWEATEYLMEADWTFWIWTAVYFIQLFWLFYGMVLTCRRVKQGFLYEIAQTMPVTIYLLFLVSLGGTVVWYFLWGRFDYVQWAALALAITTFITHICLAVVINAFVSSITDLREMGKSWDLLWNQLFTQNGIAALASWQAVITMYNITCLLLGVFDENTKSCSVGLGLIMLYILVWTIVDLFFSRRTLYYVFTPYLLVIVAFASALVRNLRGLKGGRVDEYPSLVISAIFLGITVFFLVVKVIVVAVKGRYSSDDKAEVRSLHDDNVYVMQ